MVLVLIVLALTGAALTAAQRAVLTNNVDEVLQPHGAEIASEIDVGTLTGIITGHGDDESFAQVLDGMGRVVASTTHMLDDASIPLPAGTGAYFQNVQSVTDGLEYRVLSKRFGDSVIRVGTPLDDVNDSVTALTSGLIFAVPTASLLLAVLVWLLVGRVLWPVEQICRQVAETSGSNLDRRVRSHQPTTRSPGSHTP